MTKAPNRIKSVTPAGVGPGLFTIVSWEVVGPNCYDLTTESEEHGRVTQRVLVFPASFWGKARPSGSRCGECETAAAR